MTLDIFFERYLLTLHAHRRRARPDRLRRRRARAAAAAPSVGGDRLGGRAGAAALRRAAALLHVRQPQAADARQRAAACRRSRGRAPTTTKRRRSGRAASAARWAWRRPPRYDAPAHPRATAARRGRAVLDVIAGATRTLDVCTFILARDRLGDEIAAALRSEGRARRPGAPADRRHRRLARRPPRLRAAAPLPASRWSSSCRRSARSLRGRANLRNHRKMLVADGDAALVRRPQLRRRVLRRRPATAAAPAWHDLSFDLRGELGGARRSSSSRLELRDPAQQRPSPVPAPYRIGAAPTRSLAQLVPSGPDQVDDTVQALLVSGCFMAQRRILAVTPYFVPDATLLMALTLAARRGVAGRPRPAAPLEPPPRRRRPAPAAARPRAQPARASG